jgi:hypothetical protein
MKYLDESTYEALSICVYILQKITRNAIIRQEEHWNLT